FLGMTLKRSGSLNGKGFFVFKSILLTICLGLLIIPTLLHSQGDYLLGPEDVIEIIVWGHDDLRRVIPVSLEETITFPMIGEIRAAGKTTQQLEKELAEKLGEGFLVNPQITVTVREYKSQKVFVMGQVENPGTYPISKENNLLFILSKAGGPAVLPEKAAGDEVIIVRPKNPTGKGMTLEEAEASQARIITINLKALLAGDPKQNVIIRNGDSIIIPQKPFFFVTGEVQKPGKYNLEKRTTVLMGISMAGGETKKAAPNRTKIVREVEGKNTEIRVKMEDLIQPGDTIIVPESFF
ncbi:MAG: polysaccharide biosynthesis/export family protein, partial [Pseudomonadota bacterium]